jgi:hypothetical protein
MKIRDSHSAMSSRVRSSRTQLSVVIEDRSQTSDDCIEQPFALIGVTTVGLTLGDLVIGHEPRARYAGHST